MRSYVMLFVLLTTPIVVYEVAGGLLARMLNDSTIKLRPLAPWYFIMSAYVSITGYWWNGGFLP